MTDTLPILPRCPAAVALPPYWRQTTHAGLDVIEACDAWGRPQGAVTIDTQRRVFEIGLTARPRLQHHAHHYSGRGWEVKLWQAAVNELIRLYPPDKTPAPARRFRP